MMKIIVDTNVILDTLLSREPFCNHSDLIFDLIAEGKIEAFVVSSSITDIYYLSSKVIGTDKTKEQIKILLQVFHLISEVSGEDLLNALNSDIKDFEDAILAECANKANLDYIITRDKKFLEYPKTMAPSKFLEHCTHL